MPTAAKLVAAVLMAALGFVASDAVVSLFPAGTDFGVFAYVNLGLGFLVGWITLGPRAGRGVSAGVGNGITAAVALTFWGVTVQAVYEMVQRSFDRRYDTPFEAIAAIFELMAEHGEKMLDLRLILTLLLGGILVGLVSEIAGQRWR